jgi:hypothetical protein
VSLDDLDDRRRRLGVERACAEQAAAEARSLRDRPELQADAMGNSSR